MGGTPTISIPSFYFVFKFILLFYVHYGFFGLKVFYVSYSSFICVSVFLVKIIQAGTRGHSPQREQFSLQRDFATNKKPRVLAAASLMLAAVRICTKEKTVRTRCSEINIRCSESLRPDQPRKAGIEHNRSRQTKQGQRRAYLQSIQG